MLSRLEDDTARALDRNEFHAIDAVRVHTVPEIEIAQPLALDTIIFMSEGEGCGDLLRIVEEFHPHPDGNSEMVDPLRDTGAGDVYVLEVADRFVHDLDVSLEPTFVDPDGTALDAPSSEVVSVIHLLRLRLHVDDAVGVAVQDLFAFLHHLHAVLQESGPGVCGHEHGIR